MDSDQAREIAANKAVEIVSAKVKLYTSSHRRTAKGLCPFHSEKTPSFVLWKETGKWKCFGCGERGDILTFIMKIYGVHFAHALRIATGETNITSTGQVILTSSQKQWLESAMDVAKNWAAIQNLQAQKNLCRDESTEESRNRWIILNRQQKVFLVRLDSLVEKFDQLDSRPPYYYFNTNKTVSTLILRPNVQPFLYGSPEYRKNLIFLVTNA